jgi:fibronectin type 3 domain-containing protein
LTLSGAASRVTAADGSGNYSFTGLPAGSYIVAASQSGYMFTPSTASAIINTAPVTGLNFTSTAIPAPVPHTVALSWSTSSNVIGYNVYRADVAGGTYVKVNAAPVAATSYVDSSVASGRTYYYVATALDSNNSESTYSSQAIAVVPTP